MHRKACDLCACSTDRMERDKEFATRKAERANLRVLLRDKYRLPQVRTSTLPPHSRLCMFHISLSHYSQSAQDDATVQIAGEDLDVPEELAKMVEEDEEQEEINDSFMGRLQNMDMDFDTIKAKAQSTITDVKQAAEEKCVLM